MLIYYDSYQTTTRVLRVSSETNLVIDDNMDRATSSVVRNSSKVQSLPNNTLAIEYNVNTSKQTNRNFFGRSKKLFFRMQMLDKRVNYELISDNFQSLKSSYANERARTTKSFN
jgi:hypothetical protein